MFLPDNGSSAPASGSTEFTPGTPETTQNDVALMQRVFQAAAANPLMLPADFMSYIVDYVQTSRLIIPIGQVFGFSGFTAQASDFIATSETTTSNTYTNLATVGPTLDGLAAGRYVIFLTSLSAIATAGGQAYMSVSVNGAAASDTGSSQVWTSTFASVTVPSLVTLSNPGGNSLVAKYRSSNGSTATFSNRQIFALKYAN